MVALVVFTAVPVEWMDDGATTTGGVTELMVVVMNEVTCLVAKIT